MGGKGQCKLEDFAFISKSLQFFQIARSIIQTIIEVRVSVNLTGLGLGFLKVTSATEVLFYIK